ncbi:MAG: two-component sensor histidine kinase [Actinomycetia bacterium]|nr:two-component sensor histidine kinase [Actinomycetes bacterium]
MPSNEWLAVDVTTSPTTRARELRQIWDDFLGKGRLDAVRAPIAESWRRSRAAGIDPSHSRAPTTFADRADVAKRWEAHPLEATAPLIRETLGAVADESEHLIVVTDADGLLLWVDGNVKLRSAAADSMNFVEGALWSEVGAGTNAIGTAVAADHPVQVHAAEHLSEIVHGWTCSAAPIHDPEDGRLLGIVDLTGRMRTANPHSFAVAVATARAVEAHLRLRLQEQDAQARVRYLPNSITNSEHVGLVSLAGRVIADHPDGFLGNERIDLPPGGGELILPSGRRAYAEAVDHEEVFVVRALSERHASRARLGPTSTPVGNQRSGNGVPRDGADRRRAQMELRRLAEEQAALRRVASLVAGQAAPDEIFGAVAEEVARLLRAERGVVCRYEPDETMTVTAYWSDGDGGVPVGTRVPLQGLSVATMVKKTRGPSRFDSYDGVSSPVIEVARRFASVPRSTVGAPIVVDGRVWGTILASSVKSEPFADDTEARIMRFAELVATAISNAVGRAELAASRARLVTTADEVRRRIERDLHDGTQQRLVSLALDLHAAEAMIPRELDELRAELSRMATGLAAAMEDLNAISRGIHPAILSKGGLGPALRSLCRRAPVPVELELGVFARLPDPVEVAAYYVASESLTNIAKHARASVVNVFAEVRDGILQLAIQDDGVGGADPSRGSGLVGLRDRVDAMGGTIVVESPVGKGTHVLVALPADGRAVSSPFGE